MSFIRSTLLAVVLLNLGATLITSHAALTQISNVDLSTTKVSVALTSDLCPELIQRRLVAIDGSKPMVTG
jgi:PIN domain nuclease of toxin-antitoxin system